MIQKVTILQFEITHFVHLNNRSNNLSNNLLKTY